MSSDGEMEGTPAEATWAMLTVLVIIIVVLIFCCGVPFYRALEKRWHHWDDIGNDPRWDVENFQFSPTSPQILRDPNPKYNRLSMCSTDNGSSKERSSSGINRGDSFKNNCVLPRFPDQVEFRLPPSYDDLFNKGSEVEEDSSPPSYSSTDPNYEEELIKQKNEEYLVVTIPVLQNKKEKNEVPDKLVPPTKQITTATTAVPIQPSSSKPATAAAVPPAKKTKNTTIKKPVPDK